MWSFFGLRLDSEREHGFAFPSFLVDKIIQRGTEQYDGDKKMMSTLSAVCGLYAPGDGVTNLNRNHYYHLEVSFVTLYFFSSLVLMCRLEAVGSSLPCRFFFTNEDKNR